MATLKTTFVNRAHKSFFGTKIPLPEYLLGSAGIEEEHWEVLLSEEEKIKGCTKSVVVVFTVKFPFRLHPWLLNLF